MLGCHSKPVWVDEYIASQGAGKQGQYLANQPRAMVVLTYPGLLRGPLIPMASSACPFLAASGLFPHSAPSLHPWAANAIPRGYAASLFPAGVERHTTAKPQNNPKNSQPKLGNGQGVFRTYLLTRRAGPRPTQRDTRGSSSGPFSPPEKGDSVSHCAATVWPLFASSVRLIRMRIKSHESTNPDGLICFGAVRLPRFS